MESDAFTLLGLPRRFEINSAELQAAFLRRAARLHPDRAADPIAAAAAGDETARLNEARATLADDERRANELLRLLGGPAKEQHNALPDGFLMDIMDVREQMEQVLASGDVAERQRLESWARQQREQYRAEAQRLFSEAAEAAPPGVLAQIRVLLNAWRYIERMLEQLDPSYNAAM